jgi:transcriptional regulator with XRE-family HTH domain
MQKEEFAKYIRVRAKELGLSITKLALQTGISRQSLYDLFSGTTEQAKLSTIINLANTLQVHPIYLFRHLLDQMESPRYGSPQAGSPDSMQFIRDVTIPDNVEIKVGTVFTKTWEIQNAGSTTWTGRKLVCMDQPVDSTYTPPRAKKLTTCRGLTPSAREVEIKETKAGKTVKVSVELTAPNYPCSVLSYWKMTDETGNLCALASEGLSCYVQVVE